MSALFKKKKLLWNNENYHVCVEVSFFFIILYKEGRLALSFQ